MWVVVALVLLVATAELSAAKRGKGRGKKARKFGNRGLTKNFKSEASRAYYNHNGVSSGVCWCSTVLILYLYYTWSKLTLYLYFLVALYLYCMVLQCWVVLYL